MSSKMPDVTDANIRIILDPNSPRVSSRKDILYSEMMRTTQRQQLLTQKQVLKKNPKKQEKVRKGFESSSNKFLTKRNLIIRISFSLGIVLYPDCRNVAFVFT
jgi:hypothetical protein